MSSDSSPPWKAAYEASVAQGHESYVDPSTGFHVFTELFHRRRGVCCGSACRHCPFAHERVPPPRTQLRTHAPTLVGGQLLSLGAGKGPPLDVVFWSGGKDSWLAWQHCVREGASAVWLTTYDPSTSSLSVQGVSVSKVRSQALAADIPLMLVPVVAGTPYRDQVIEGLELLRRKQPIGRLVFGDLWLSDVREARETDFETWAREVGASLWFPLWKRQPAELLPMLFEDGPPVRVSASSVDGVAVGATYDQTLVALLSADIDPMGERGEFHTVVDLAPA